MYRYKTRSQHCVRFVFPDGRQINLLGKDVTLTFEGSAAEPSRKVEIKGATTKDFESILKNDRYKSMHKRIVKIEKPVLDEEPVKEDKNVSNKKGVSKKSDSK